MKIHHPTGLEYVLQQLSGFGGGTKCRVVGPSNLANRDIQDLHVGKDTPMEVAEVFGCRYVVIVEEG